MGSLGLLDSIQDPPSRGRSEFRQIKMAADLYKQADAVIKPAAFKVFKLLGWEVKQSASARSTARERPDLP